MPRYLISYDIASTKARSKISTRLENVGRRIQESVFIVKCTENYYINLVQELRQFIGVEYSLLCMPCCEQCFAKAIISAEAPPLMFFE